MTPAPQKFVDEARPLNKAELKVLSEFSREMETKTIPAIVKVMRKRAVSAQKARSWIIL